MRKIEKILRKYKRGDLSQVIPCLQDIQENFGYLPENALQKMSQCLNIPLSHLYGVVTFYTGFSLTRRGKNIIRLCEGTACHIRGSKEILKAIENTLGIKAGEATTDYKFSLEIVRCLGTCFLAPVMMINHNYYGKLTPEKIKPILSQIK